MEPHPKATLHLKALTQAMVEVLLLLVITAQAMVIAAEALPDILHLQEVVHHPKAMESRRPSHKSMTQTADTLIKIFRQQQNELKYKCPVFYFFFYI